MITEQEKIKEIRSIYKAFCIPNEHKPYIFMCPKEKDGNVGFIMYIYGGQAFWFYYGTRGIKVSIPSDGYIKYFKPEDRGREIFAGIKGSKIQNKTADEKIECMKNWSESAWDEVCNAFRNWAVNTIKPNYERMRETRICYANSDNDDIRVFDMEEKMDLEGVSHKPEADIVSLRHVNGKPVFSVIEYKCTTSAVTGKVSIPEHYRDMVMYYRNKKIVKKLIRLYNWKQEFDERSIEEISETDAVNQTEIVFLFSNIVWNETITDKSNSVSNGSIYKKLEILSGEEGFENYKSHIKVLFLTNADDANVDLKLYSDEIKSYGKALELLKPKKFQRTRKNLGS